MRLSQTTSAQLRPKGPTAMPTARTIDSLAITDEAIARRAYEKYVSRGCAHGQDQEDWAAATRELIAEALGR